MSPHPTGGSRPDFEPADACVMCNKSPAKRCKQCSSCYYCSRECQESDWPSHKLLCKALSTQGPRPSPAHRRAILFPVDHDKPRMAWLPCEREISDEEFDNGISCEVVDLHPHLGMDRPIVGTRFIEHNPIRDRNLGSGMAVWALRKEGYSVALKFREAFLIDGSAINRSILMSLGASGTTPPHSWSGPIVAIRQTPSEPYEDITLADFRHIIDYLGSYRTNEARESAAHLEDRHPTSIRGVKICCYGEIKLHGSEPYVSVDISRAHPIRVSGREGAISPISKLLGMPLRLWKDRDIDTWINPPGWDANMNADNNQDAAFLMMQTDLKDPGWGWAPLYWNLDLGNVLVVREDGKDLAVDNIRTICCFIRRKLQPMFEDALGGGYVSRTKQEVLDFISWENMMKCREAMLEESSRT